MFVPVVAGLVRGVYSSPGDIKTISVVSNTLEDEEGRTMRSSMQEGNIVAREVSVKNYKKKIDGVFHNNCYHLL